MRKTAHSVAGISVAGYEGETYQTFFFDFSDALQCFKHMRVCVWSEGRGCGESTEVSVSRRMSTTVDMGPTLPSSRTQQASNSTRAQQWGYTDTSMLLYLTGIVTVNPCPLGSPEGAFPGAASAFASCNASAGIAPHSVGSLTTTPLPWSRRIL